MNALLSLTVICECFELLLQPNYCGQKYFDGLVQERRNSSALAMKLCQSCKHQPIDMQQF